MKRLLATVATLIALQGCVSRSPRCKSNDAQGLVEALKPRDQFKSMLTMTVGRSQTAGMVSARDGLAAAPKLARAVDKAVERHGLEWQRNLVTSWQTLSAAEIQQVCRALQQRDEQTFQRFAQRVGPDAQTRNQPLLHRAAAEVLDTVW